MPSSPLSLYKRQLDAVRKLDDRGAIAPYLEAAKRLAATYPKLTSAWIELGKAYASIGRYSDAQKALDKSVSVCVTEFLRYPYIFKGITYYEQAKYKLAEKWFRRCIELDSKDAEAWAYLGITLAYQGRNAEAKVAWRKQIRIGTGATDEGHLNLGLLLRSELRYKDALRQADKALELNPSYKEAQELRIDLLEVIGNGI